MLTTLPSLGAQAKKLGDNWELRARSANRDFYVSSHLGWNNESARQHQSRCDTDLILHGLEPKAITDWHLLEIGCGVGRLAHELAGRFASYTGFDIAPSMIDEARRRGTQLPSTRFFVSDGTRVPYEARDRGYDLVLAFAVFIHCPKDVIWSNIRSAFGALAPGGQLRFQMRADPEDHDGLVSLEAASSVHAEMAEIEAAITDEQRELLEGTDYMGHAFRYAELGPWLEGLTGGQVHLVRIDLASIYGWIKRPESQD